MAKQPPVAFTVEQGDILSRPGDVIALKHADALYGVDEVVYKKMLAAGREAPRLPKIYGFTLHPTLGTTAATNVLFVGVEPLRGFGYEQIRSFGERVLTSLAGSLPSTKTLLLTVHGPGYGLDEVEAFSAELSGLLDAITSGDYPESLKDIIFVERNPGRASRLRYALKTIFPDTFAGGFNEQLRTAGSESEAKPLIFVAMPFAKEFEDTFHYGIESAVHSAGYLCERADLSSFAGDIVTWVKERISRASLVIAELSGGNPNVYLEVGYAWGRGIPTVLLVRNTEELKFDVRGQRCLAYENIMNLEEKLTKELTFLPRGRSR